MSAFTHDLIVVGGPSRLGGDAISPDGASELAALELSGAAEASGAGSELSAGQSQRRMGVRSAAGGRPRRATRRL
jgi:hypothetical protein